MEPTLIQRGSPVPPALGDPTVCYCYNLTRGDLLASHRKHGSLAGVQADTRAGTKCGGCRLMLESLFGEMPGDMYAGRGNPATNSHFCVQPGSVLMKGFVVANHELDTTVFASNGVPPQFGVQDTTVPIEYALLDQNGKVVLGRRFEWKTHETFRFDTREENLPRPLYGTFLFHIGRGNYGASRFNCVWTNGVSSCATHEINHSGRPTVALPLFADREFLAGPNTIYLAIQNPHPRPMNIRIRMFDEGNRDLSELVFPLAPGRTEWVNASRECYGPALEKHPRARAALAVRNHPVDFDLAPTTYFFFHNRNTGIWTVNHL